MSWNVSVAGTVNDHTYAVLVLQPIDVLVLLCCSLETRNNVGLLDYFEHRLSELLQLVILLHRRPSQCIKVYLISTSWPRSDGDSPEASTLWPCDLSSL